MKSPFIKGDIVAWMIVTNNGRTYTYKIVEQEPEEPRFPALSWVVPLHAGDVSPRRANWLDMK